MNCEYVCYLLLPVQRWQKDTVLICNLSRKEMTWCSGGCNMVCMHFSPIKITDDLVGRAKQREHSNNTLWKCSQVVLSINILEEGIMKSRSSQSTCNFSKKKITSFNNSLRLTGLLLFTSKFFRILNSQQCMISAAFY